MHVPRVPGTQQLQQLARTTASGPGIGPGYGHGVAGEVDTRWLLVSVTTAGAAASLEDAGVADSEGLGALYLQQSVCLLPDRAEVARAVAELEERVRSTPAGCGWSTSSYTTRTSGTVSPRR